MDATYYSSIELAAAAFASLHPEWSTPAGSHDRCEDAANAFLAWLRAQDGDWTPPRIVQFSRGGRCPAQMAALFATGLAGDLHSVVVADGVVVDLTARQYDATAAFPLTYDL